MSSSRNWGSTYRARLCLESRSEFEFLSGQLKIASELGMGMLPKQPSSTPALQPGRGNSQLSLA